MINEKISVCIPVYNGAETIKQAIESVLRQTMTDFELVIVDNASTDNTVDLVKSIDDERIKLFVNEKDLGVGGNLVVCKQKAAEDILFYLCADDVLASNALELVISAFSMSSDVGIILRPYYWFSQNFHKPVRATKQFSETEIVSIDGSYDKIKEAISSAGQISGIAFRKKFIKTSFKNDPFLEMASVVAPTLKECKAVILKDNIVAIRIGNNNGAMDPAAYKKSPMLSWHQLIVKTFYEERFAELRKYLIKNFVTNNYISLVQIKNFGGFKALFREIFLLTKLQWLNIFNISFWFFSLGTIIVPGFLLRKMVGMYKNNINSRFLKDIVISDGGKR